MLKLQFLQYKEIDALTSEQRIAKILELVKDDNIVLLEGRVTAREESELIAAVMKEISPKFTGIELAVIDPDQSANSMFMKIRKSIAALLLGSRAGFTIIGPAKIIREIKQDPSKIELYTVEADKQTRKRR